jgi:two-component system, LytTR family, sensor kinase
MFALKRASFINMVIGACLFALAPLIFVYSQSGFANVSKLIASYEYWLFIIYFLIVYFLLQKFVVPKLYFKKKAIAFTAVVIVLMAATLVVKPFDRLIHFSYRGKGQPPKEMFEKKPLPPPGNKDNGEQKPPGPDMGKKGGPMFDMVSSFLLLLIFLIVITDKAVKKSRLTEKRAVQAEADRAYAELSFLKAQINPHFLFNTLNNIYSLAVTKNEKTADAVMKLSNIMRYVTDGNGETMVPLDEETSCITDYISLQKLRLGENFPVDFSVEGNTAGKTIPPLCLMTFVENAFKHGISNHEQNSVVFKIQVQDKYIHFLAQNKLFSTARNTERTGIGIENTQKRLNVIYPEKHVLAIEEKAGFYTVNLILYS